MCVVLCLYISAKMVPLIERSSTTLVEKLGECAESGKATELFK